MGFNNRCVFCERQPVAKNEQGFSTCRVHKTESLPDMKCVCGQVLSIKESKYGAFFLCMDCGPISLKKAFDINPPVQPKVKEAPREITVRSDETDFL
jgi:hypothetical protein